MNRFSRKNRAAVARGFSHEDVNDEFLRTVPGEKRRLTDDLKYGFRVWSDGKQIASVYFGENSPGNEVEFALNFRLLEEDRRMHATVKSWLDQKKLQLGTREANVHQRGNPVDWFRVGFESLEQALKFLKQLRSERFRSNRADRWRVADEHAASDMIGPFAAESDEEATAGRMPEKAGARHREWTQSVARMVATAEQTILQSNGEPALKSIKDKQSGFGSHGEFECYVQGLLETQGARCAISGLPLQRDEACNDPEMLASLDRIDSDGDYAPGNLQVVCRFINRWKGADDNALFSRLLGQLREGNA